MLSLHVTKLIALGLFLASLSAVSGCASVSWSATCTVKKGDTSCTIGASGKSQQVMCVVKDHCTKIERVEAFFASLMRKASNFFVTEANASTLFDPSSGRLDIWTVNAALVTTNGTFTVYLYGSGNLIAQNSFVYYVQGQSVYVSDPSGVSAWLNSYNGQYDSYSGSLGGLSLNPTTTAETSGSMTASLVYDGAIQASATVSFPVNSGGTCGIGKDCKQF